MALLLGAVACSVPSTVPGGPVRVVVYTQNLFIGADLLTLGGRSFRGKSFRQILREVEGTVDSIVRDIEFHDFPARARGIARQARTSTADVLLLQEVTLLRRRACPGHLVWLAVAQSCVYDYLEILMAALRAEGLEYRAAVVTENFDEEAPSAKYGYVRFTDRDAILVRRDLSWSGGSDRHFRQQWERRVAVRTISLKKGYQEVTIEKAGRRFRVVNTHLERLGRFKEAQNQELLERFGKATLPTIVGGDFNADPSVDTAFFRKWRTDYRDTWAVARGARGGGTCCFSIPLTSTAHRPGARWDLLLASKHFSVQSARVVADMVRSEGPPARRLWLSDHAGVVADLTLP